MMHNCSAEEEIARWKATAEQEAAVGTSVEQEFVAQIKFTAIGVYLDPEIVPAEKFIRVVVTKEIKGSQHGVQIESAVRDRLGADDKYEEEEEALEKVLPIKVLQEGFCHHIPSSCNFCLCRDCVYTLENFGYE
ncbi:hypothetical protein ACFX15_024578 [Malus domestica]